jgi:hypothetical protein
MHWFKVSCISFVVTGVLFLFKTIFDPSIFVVWAEEAFSLWSSMWLSLYEYDSKSYELIERIRDTYYLVALIDNDFSSGGPENKFVLLDLLLELGAETQ